MLRAELDIVFRSIFTFLLLSYKIKRIFARNKNTKRSLFIYTSNYRTCIFKWYIAGKKIEVKLFYVQLIEFTRRPS